MTESPATDAQLRRLFGLFNDLGVTSRQERLTYFQTVLHGGVSSSRELTAGEASRLIEALEAEVLFSDSRRSLEAAEIAKQARRRELLDALAGRLPGGEASESGGFDSGARRALPAAPETHELTLAEVLRTGEADAGRSI